MLKKFFSAKNIPENPAVKTEGEYYKELFVNNPLWNKPTPNEEEFLRWEIIEKFIYFIKGYHKASGIPDEINILDLGCGRGWLSKLLSYHGKIIAIDPIDDVIKHAKTMFPDIPFQTGTTDTLLNQGMENSFDLLVCSEVFEHIPDHHKSDFVRKLKKLVKNKGFVILTTPRKEMQAEWTRFNNPGQPVEDWMDEQGIKDLFREKYFEPVLLNRHSAKPTPQTNEIEIYQLWLFQNHK